MFSISDHLLNDVTGRAMSHHQPPVEPTSYQNDGSHAARLNAVGANMSCHSSPAKFAHKDFSTAKYSNSQNFVLRTEEEDLIQKVSDVMKMEQCDKLMKVSVDGLNTASSTSSNHSQKSSESSNSFYASIPNRLATNQPPVCDPVISLMLSNNQPPLQLHNRVCSNLQVTNNGEQNREKLLILDQLTRKESLMQPTYANFTAKNMVNGTRRDPVRMAGDTQQGYSPGIYAVSYFYVPGKKCIIIVFIRI